jgi:lysophospholipase L1-like esterase
VEFLLHISSYVSQNFLAREQQNNWLTPNLRIVAMGDSNTYGLYLDRKDSYPKQLESIWNAAHKNKPIEVINLGYPGASSSRLVANFGEVIRQFQPDIVLVMIGTNDSWTAPIAAAELALNDDKKFHPIQWIKLHSRIYRFYCLLSREPFQEEALETITTSDPNQAETAKGKPATINYEDTKLDFSMSFRPPTMQFDVEAEMQKNMEKLIQYGKINNAKVFLLTYAANKGYYKQANKVTLKTAQENQYPYLINTIDTFKDFQPHKGEDNPYFFADLHATALGNRILATETMHQLESKLGTFSEVPTP